MCIENYFTDFSADQMWVIQRYTKYFSDKKKIVVVENSNCFIGRMNKHIDQLSKVIRCFDLHGAQ